MKQPFLLQLRWRYGFAREDIISSYSTNIFIGSQQSMLKKMKDIFIKLYFYCALFFLLLLPYLFCFCFVFAFFLNKGSFCIFCKMNCLTYHLGIVFIQQKDQGIYWI